VPPIKQVIKRTGVVVPFNKERIVNAIYRAAVAVGGRDRSIAEGLANQVLKVLEQTMPAGQIPTVEEIQDIVEKVLIENGHARTAKAYILYREERSRHRRQKTAHQNRDSSNIPYRKLWETLSWATDHDLNTVDRLNARIARGEFPDIVRESDTFYEEDVHTAAELIKERLHELKIVIIAGPSSSGKTTTTIKLENALKQSGVNLVALNVDNYFHDLALHPRDEFGDYDFETPQALDLQLIDEHLDSVL
jgi:uridine kinase